MGVVARLNVQSVEHTAWGRTTKMTPVIASGKDVHDEEIKKFFAATPGGSVSLYVPKGEELEYEPGDEAYLYLDFERGTSSLADDFYVRSVTLNDWATQVKFDARNRAIDEITHHNPSTMEFSIRNETAAEQFQVGDTVYVRLVKVQKHDAS